MPGNLGVTSNRSMVMSDSFAEVIGPRIAREASALAFGDHPMRSEDSPVVLSAQSRSRRSIIDRDRLDWTGSDAARTAGSGSAPAQSTQLPKVFQRNEHVG